MPPVDIPQPSAMDVEATNSAKSTEIKKDILKVVQCGVNHTLQVV